MASVFDFGEILARDNQRGFGHSSDGLSVGGQSTGRRIHKHHVVALHCLMHQALKSYALEQFLWVRRHRPGGEHTQVVENRDSLGRVTVRAAGEDRREADTILHTQDLVLARIAHVGIDEQRPFAKLGKYYRQIRCDIGPPFLTARADHGQAAPFDIGIEPTHQELSPNRPQRLDLRRERLVCRDQFGGETALSGTEVGVLELPRQDTLNVIFSQQPQLFGRITETKSFSLLNLQDSLGVLRDELPGVDQELPYAPVRGLDARFDPECVLDLHGDELHESVL